MIGIKIISGVADIAGLCQSKKELVKKMNKPSKAGLTFGFRSGNLNKLFDGDEVEKSGTKKFEKT